MTQEEVDLIYDYLHENYEYVDGELIRCTSKYGAKKGDRFGFLAMERNNKIGIKCSIGSGEDKKIFNLSHLIYIYFHKEKPKYIDFLDGNFANTKIENLESISRNTYALKCIDGRGFVPMEDKDGNIRYHCQIRFQKKTISLGVFESKCDAKQLYLKAKKLLLNGHSIDYIKSTLTSHKSSKNKTGFKGIRCVNGKYYGVFQKNKQKKYTAVFNTPEEAHEAYLKAKAEHA
jgi:hypothetical protein